MTSATKTALNNAKAEIKARAQLRESITTGTLVTIAGKGDGSTVGPAVDGIWRVCYPDAGGGLLRAYKQKNGKDWQGSRTFERSRCTPIFRA